jgi:hypothetical protein
VTVEEETSPLEIVKWAFEGIFLNVREEVTPIIGALK